MEYIFGADGISKVSKKAAKKSLLRLQRNTCALCGGTLQSDYPIAERAKYRASLDHVWPLGRGGHDGAGNVLAAHVRCNNRKGAREPTGCEVVWLTAVCARAGIPLRMKPGLWWNLPPLTATLTQA